MTIDDRLHFDRQMHESSLVELTYCDSISGYYFSKLQADLKIGESQSAIMGGFAGPDMEDRSLSAGNLREGTSSVGGAYDDIDSVWPVRGRFKLIELEVYANANIEPMGSGGFKLWPF